MAPKNIKLMLIYGDEIIKFDSHIHTHLNKTMTLQIHNECKKKQQIQFIRYMRNIIS